MTKPVIAVLGATGIQGGSVITALRHKSDVHIRGITRDPTSDKAQGLRDQGVEVVQADLNDADTLRVAFENSQVIYAVTNFWEHFALTGGDALYSQEMETRQGKAIADAAAATPTLDHFIWSTVPDVKALRGPEIPHFESKNAVDRYIRQKSELLEKTTFLFVPFYHLNYRFSKVTKPHFVQRLNRYVQFGTHAPDTPVPNTGDVRANLGKFVRASIEQPEKVRDGAVVIMDVDVRTSGEMLQLWAKANEVEATYLRTDFDIFESIFPKWGEEISTMMKGFNQAGRDWGRGLKDAVKVVRWEDLGITGLVGLEEAFRALGLDN